MTPRLGGGEFAIILLVALLIGLIPMILYLINLQKTMEQVAPQNRRMSPGSVWLSLIPIFSLIWNFMMVANIADSLAAEYRSRNLRPNEERPAYSIGLGMSICFACGWIPFIGSLASLVGLVLFIIYWVKTAGYRRELENTPAYFSPNAMNNNQQYYQQFNQSSYNQQGGYNNPPNYNPGYNQPNNPPNYPPNYNPGYNQPNNPPNYPPNYNPGYNQPNNPPDYNAGNNPPDYNPGNNPPNTPPGFPPPNP